MKICPNNVVIKGLITESEFISGTDNQFKRFHQNEMVKLTVVVRQNVSPKSFKDLQIVVLAKPNAYKKFKADSGEGKWISVSGELHTLPSKNGYIYYVTANQIGHFGDHSMYEEFGGEARYTGRAICRMQHNFNQDDEKRENTLNGKIINFVTEYGEHFSAVAMRNFSRIDIEEGDVVKLDAKLMPPRSDDLLPYFSLKGAQKEYPFQDVKMVAEAAAV